MLDPQTVHDGFPISTPDGRRLTGDTGLTFQGVHDGEILTITAGIDDPPPRVYDDIVEAMADVVEDEMRPWEPEAGRRTALSAACLMLGLGALALAVQRPSAVAATAAGVLAVILVAGAIVLARVQREAQAAVVLAWVAVGYAVVAGLAAVPTPPLLELPVAAAGGAALVVGLVATVGLAEHRALLLPAVAVGAVAAASSGILTISTLSAASVYAVALVATVLVGSAFPWLSLGTTGTRVEQAHTDADLTAEPRHIDRVQVQRDALLGHEVLVGVTATVGLLLVLVTPLAVGLGVEGALLAVCASLILMLRTRQYRVGSEVGVGLGFGVAALLTVAVSVMVLQPGWRPALALVLAVTGAAMLVLTLVPSTPSVRRGRMGDIAEVVALVALLPLLVLAIGLVGSVRS